MLEEFEQDLAKGTIFRSGRLTENGWRRYPALLREAIQFHDDEWLATTIRDQALLHETELAHYRSGKISKKKVSWRAPWTLAEDQFNRFYVRGVCRAALDTGNESVEVYRAKSVSQPRPDSQRRIGTKVNAAALLADLRQNMELESALHIPGGPNSGISVRFGA